MCENREREKREISTWERRGEVEGFIRRIA
jgi:hypothetical protein